MRVALISDLHANLVALDAVLADIRRVGHDRIVCLGDVATLGPEPNAIFERLDQLGCLTILGNHDEFLLDEQLIHTYTEAPIVVEAVDWCRARTTAAELDFVRRFQTTAEIVLSDRVKLFLFHGSPRSHMENLLATTHPAELDVFLDGHQAAVLAGGHTHLQLLRQHRGMLLVNPGSTGMPFKEFVTGRAPTLLPHAEYATVEAIDDQPVVTLRRVNVDQKAVRRVVEQTSNPLREALLAPDMKPLSAEEIEKLSQSRANVAALLADELELPAPWELRTSLPVPTRWPLSRGAELLTYGAGLKQASSPTLFEYTGLLGSVAHDAQLRTEPMFEPTSAPIAPLGVTAAQPISATELAAIQGVLPIEEILFAMARGETAPELETALRARWRFFRKTHGWIAAQLRPTLHAEFLAWLDVT